MTPAPDRQARERAGRRAEDHAALFLRLKGYRIRARRWRCPAGEIDLIAQRGRTLIFVEVKRRQTAGKGREAVSPAQQQRIARAAEAYLANHPGSRHLQMRFDLIVVLPRALPLHLRHAWQAQ